MVLTETTRIALITVGGMIISGLGGALIGSWLGPAKNHKYSMEKLETEHEKRIDYMEKEAIFNRRLENSEEIIKRMDTARMALFSLIRILMDKNGKIEEKRSALKKSIETEGRLIEINFQLNDLYEMPKEINMKLGSIVKIIVEIKGTLNNFAEKGREKDLVKTEEKLKTLRKEFNEATLETSLLIKKSLKNY